MGIETSYNFCRVNDKLTTSGFVPPRVLKTMSAQGYEVVVNLLPDNHEHAVRGERQVIESQGLEYVYIPVDFKHPARSDYAEFSESLDRVLEKKIHMHCAANYRVSAFYALYEIHHGRWNKEQAMNFLSEIWPLSEHPVWAAFVSDMVEAPHQR